MIPARFEKVADEALARIAGPAPLAERGPALIGAALRIPRMPALAPLHARLIGTLLERGAPPLAPAHFCDGARLILRVALQSGLAFAGQTLLGRLSEILAEEGEEDPLRAWVAQVVAVTAAMGAGDLQTATAALDTLSETTAGVPSAQSPELRAGPLEVDLALLSGMTAYASQDLEGAATHFRAALAALPDEGTPGGVTWEGERAGLHHRLALVEAMRDAPMAALSHLEEARITARSLGLFEDEAGLLIAMSPLWMATDQAGTALELLGEALERAKALDKPLPQEMRLRSLHVDALDAVGELGPAIAAGFEAIERCGPKGSLIETTSLVIRVAELYQKGHAYADAYHVLASAVRGMRGRPNAEPCLELLRQAQGALRLDLGPELHDQVAREARKMAKEAAGER